jgi:hypothetical protein
MAKPTTLPLWATTGTKVTPSAGQQQAGWSPNDRPPAHWFNWWQNLVYTWFVWIDSKMEDGTNSSAIKFYGVDIVAADTNAYGMKSFGSGTGPGVWGTGGATGGRGGLFTGQDTGAGIYAQGDNVSGSAFGGDFLGGVPNGAGVQATGKGSGSGGNLYGGSNSSGNGGAGGNATGGTSTGSNGDGGTGFIATGGLEHGTGDPGTGGIFRGNGASGTPNVTGAGIYAEAADASGAAGGEFVGGSTGAGIIANGGGASGTPSGQETGVYGKGGDLAPGIQGVGGTGNASCFGGTFTGGDWSGGDGSNGVSGNGGDSTGSNGNGGAGVRGFGGTGNGSGHGGSGGVFSSDTYYGLEASGDATAPAYAAFRIWPQNADPTQANTGDLIITSSGHTDGEGYLKVYNGTAWEKVGVQT